jgi:hypothetical protein
MFFIGKILNKLSNFKRGVPFTQEEDEIIKKRVLDWGNRGSGLWVSIQKELNRPASNIIYRWNNHLNHDKKDQTFKQSKWKVEEVIMNDECEYDSDDADSDDGNDAMMMIVLMKMML